MKKILVLITMFLFTADIYAATINLTNTSTADQFSLTVSISGVNNSVGEIRYAGLDGATTISKQMLLNQSNNTNGDFRSKLIILPLNSGTYNVTATANVDGVDIKSNTVKINVSDQQLKQAQAQVHQVESQVLQDVKTNMPAIRQEIQQQEQFINQLSDTINDQK